LQEGVDQILLGLVAGAREQLAATSRWVCGRSVAD
jgi:hypothetical protein